jgi:hypothetical protein
MCLWARGLVNSSLAESMIYRQSRERVIGQVSLTVDSILRTSRCWVLLRPRERDLAFAFRFYGQETHCVIFSIPVKGVDVQNTDDVFRMVRHIRAPLPESAVRVHSLHPLSQKLALRLVFE